MKKNRPWLYLIVGPNGAGKTTLYESVIRPKNALPFINADNIQKNEIEDSSLRGSIRAALYAGRRRHKMVKNRMSFITESVFTSKSDIGFIAKARSVGFGITIFHIGVRLEALSVERVKSRVAKGGHNVPEDKIRERFRNNKRSIHDAVLDADYAYVYDNSIIAKAPSLQLRLVRGKVIYVSSELEKWCAELYEEQI